MPNDVINTNTTNLHGKVNFRICKHKLHPIRKENLKLGITDNNDQNNGLSNQKILYVSK